LIDALVRLVVDDKIRIQDRKLSHLSCCGLRGRKLKVADPISKLIDDTLLIINSSFELLLYNQSVRISKTVS